MLRRLLNARNTRPGARLALVRAIAGLPVAMRQTRRGSFLIMVVGTLALLAIITIVYVSIGRSDRQTSMAALKHDDRRDTPDQLGAYLSSVIADDLFDTIYLGERNQNGDPIFRREAFDYPSTAYAAILPLGSGDTPSTAITVGDAADARFHFTPTGNGTGTDPWLASSEPCLLDFEGAALTGGPQDYFRERLDWLNISNFAPDGAFVNLFNLRGNTSNGRSQGNFDATPWEMRGYDLDNRSAAAPLTLFEDAPAMGGRGVALDYGAPAVASDDADALPAQWTARGRWLAHPSADPVYAPGEPEYMLYQYADADGDGILDSRWFELVEDRDRTDNIEHWLIERDDDMRFFFAVRAVDLSGRINVNTATDSTLAPLAADPLGVLPGGVDIRPYLTLEGFYTDLRTNFGYEVSIQGSGVSDYSAYNSVGANGELPHMVGEKAYDALRMVLDTGIMPERGYAGLQYLAGGAAIDREFGDGVGGLNLNPYWDPYWKTTGAFGPSDYYSQFAGFGSGGGAGYAPGGILDSGLGRFFTADSLLELLTYNGVNDDRTNSPLEVALGGRADGYPGFSPLRDNRQTDSVERLRGEWVGGAFQFYDEAKAALYTDIRQRLTTLGGGRPIFASVVRADLSPGGNPDYPDPTGLPLTDTDTDTDNDGDIDIYRATKRPIGKLFPANATGQDLFELYAAALSPYSDIQQHWDPAAGFFDEFRTLYYGNDGPYLALQTAGFLAVNMLDAYDDGDIHTKRTLLFNGSQSFRSNALDNSGRDPSYPWKLLDLDFSNTTAYPKLWDGTNIADMPEAVNVFGIEAQPFITEAASFIMYTDTPNGAPIQGDEDFPMDDNNDGSIDFNDDSWGYRPSINGNPDASNPDCLFEVIAFQIHNPFDESITLKPGTATGADADQFYIQYGGKYYKISEFDFQGNTETQSQINLGPRQSKTFYILSANKNRIIARIINADFNGIHDAQTVDKWLDTQFGDEAIRITEFDPMTGFPSFPASDFTSPHSAIDAENQVIKLWRIEKPEFDLANGGFGISGVDETTQNAIGNDTLVDRMRDSSTTGPTLNRELAPSPDQFGEIPDADSGQEPPDTPTSEHNRGLTITRWAKLSRRDDPQAAAGTVPQGGLPAYCLEAKDQSNTASSNQVGEDGSLEPLRVIDFTAGDAGALTLPAALLKQATGAAPIQLVETIDEDPQDKSTGTAIGSNLAGIPFEGGLVGAIYQPPLYVEPSLNNNKFEVNGISTMRVADLLLPMGIGPHQIPMLNGLPPAEDIQWTTLSEALAIALAYDQPPAPSVYHNMYFDPAGTIEPLLDRACLRYDAFVPFIDLDTDGLFDGGEPRWGLGIPAAANIFDAITTLPPKFGSIDAVTHGQININTASRETLRALPALSPPNTTNPDGTPNWWWTAPDVHDWRSDIATTIFAYRNKLAVFPRDVTGAEPAEPLNFRDWWDLAAGTRLPPPGFPVPPGESPLENARWGTTGVAGIRESLGFRSLGELAFIRDWGYPVNPAYPFAHDIDRLGYDESNLDAEGVDSVAYDYDGDGNKTDDDEIDDDFSERLALANAVMASSSVRSDVFAVWFIVHGYRESDVKGLGVNDPMVPSVARRFVMVVDRSNVTKPGDEPRIVLFKEVPL